MINIDGSHSSSKITLFNDKPTKIKAWVVAEDNVTVDNKKGVWETIYNPIPLMWSYRDESNGDDYTEKVYDVLKVDKTQIRNDKKIYLVFTVSNNGYTIDNTDLSTHQIAFEKIGKIDNYTDYCKTTVDVSSLVDSSTPPLEVLLKLKKGSTNCFVYKVKISLK